MIRIIGIDPGFASTGWAIAEFTSGRPRVLEVGVVRTQKAQAKLRTLAADDNFRRAREVSEALARLCRTHGARLVCAEAMSPMRNASSAAKVAMCWGVVAATCELLEIPLAQVSPQRLKKTLLGRVQGTDPELQAELERRYPELVQLMTSIRAKTQRQHAYDAVGAIEACREGEVFRALQSAAAASVGAGVA